MAHPSVLRKMRAAKEDEALKVVEELLGERSELLERARNDVSRSPEFANAALVIELVHVVADQHKRIEALEKSRSQSTSLRKDVDDAKDLDSAKGKRSKKT